MTSPVVQLTETEEARLLLADQFHAPWQSGLAEAMVRYGRLERVPGPEDPLHVDRSWLPWLAASRGADAYTELLGEGYQRRSALSADYINQWRGYIPAIRRFAEDLDIGLDWRFIVPSSSRERNWFRMMVFTIHSPLGAEFLAAVAQPGYPERIRQFIIGVLRGLTAIFDHFPLYLAVAPAIADPNVRALQSPEYTPDAIIQYLWRSEGFDLNTTGQFAEVLRLIGYTATETAQALKRAFSGLDRSQMRSGLLNGGYSAADADAAVTAVYG